MKKLVIILVVLLIIAGVLAAALYFFKGKKSSQVTTFEECMEAGNLVVETHPRECHTKDKKVFVEEGNAWEMRETIEVKMPVHRELVESPFKVEGKVVGTWFYNKQLSMKLVDSNQKVIGTGFVKATEDIDEGSWVPFVGVMHFEEPQTEKGFLVIEKTNPANLDSYENPITPGPLFVPVLFNYQPTPSPTATK